MIAETRKFWVAVIGALITAASYVAGQDMATWGANNTRDLILAIAVPVLTALGVWLVPNKPPAS